MIKFVAKQLAGLVMTVVVASFVVYSSMYLSPGGPESVLFGNRQPSEEVRRAVRHHLGLDEPFLPRYFHWLGSVLSGDLGTSLVSQQPVGDRIGHPFLVTIGLIAYASFLVVVLGVGLGLAAALWPGPVDGAVTGLVSVATALPAFVASSLAISLFAVRLHWFPGYGADPGAAGWLRGSTLPAFSLAIIAFGLLARITRAMARLQLGSDHVQTAVARGVGRPRIVRAHVLRNISRPVLTTAGTSISGLFAATIVVEQAFGLNGMGQLLVTSVSQKDFPVVQAITLVIVIAFVTVNLLTDVIGAALDPRIRVAS